MRIRLFVVACALLALMACNRENGVGKDIDTLKDSVTFCREEGKNLRNSSRFTEATEMHKRGLAIAERLKDTLEIVQALNNIGTDYRRMGILDEASSYHYRALNITSQYSDKADLTSKKNEVVSLNGIGNILLTMDDLKSADSIFRRALHGEEELKSSIGLAINYANIGAIFARQNQNDSALHYYNKSMEMNQKADSKLGISLCHTHIGEIYEKQGKPREAAAEYLEAYKLMKGEGDRWHAIESCIALAELYMKNGLTAQATPYLDEAWSAAEGLNSKEHFARVYRLKYKLYEAQGDYRKALASLEKSTVYNDSITSEKNMKHMQNLMLQHERQTKEYAIGRLENELNKEKLSNTYMAFAAALVLVVMLAVIVLLLNRSRRQQKRAKEDITKAYEETKRALEYKTSFMKSIKHEIRTPLNGIMGFSQVLANMVKGNEQLCHMTDIIERQGQQLAEIIDTILEYTDIDTRTPKMEEFDLDSLVNEATNAIYDKKAEGVEVTYAAKEKGYRMTTDREMMKIALGTVLDNAAKFTQKGKIEIDARNDYGMMTIMVSDTGPGIPQDKKEWVFEQFTKVDDFVPGMGMGLTLCRALVTRLGGLVCIDEKYTAGCRVIIRIPNIK